MCLVLFAWDAHPEYKLILAANRDENFSRPSAPASFWEDAPDILAGRDLESGGTWLGMNKSGKFAAVTNYRNPAFKVENPPSRGRLTLDYLKEKNGGPIGYLKQRSAEFLEYAGFNLLVGTYHAMFHYSNRERRINRLEPGIYGLSNHLLDTPWPKVKRGKEKLENLVFVDGWNHDDLLEMMYDLHQPPDVDLPYTGVPLKWERALAPMFIKTDNYGTCCTTVLTIDRKGEVAFTEKTYPPACGERVKETQFEFSISSVV